MKKYLLFLFAGFLMLVESCSVLKNKTTEDRVESASKVSTEVTVVKAVSGDTSKVKTVETITTEYTKPGRVVKAAVDYDSLQKNGIVFTTDTENGVAQIVFLNKDTGKISTFLLLPGDSYKQTVQRDRTDQTGKYEAVEGITAKQDSVGVTKNQAIRSEEKNSSGLSALTILIICAVAFALSVLAYKYLLPGLNLVGRGLKWLFRKRQ